MFDPKTKFLVVDDFLIMRNLVKKILHDSGYANVATASNGEEAFKLVQQSHEKSEPFDVIVSDWNMPVMTGLDLLKLCKADEKFKSLAFVMVTAESEQSQIIEAVKSGVSEYVVKPFNAVTFREKLEKVYAKHSTQKKVA